RGEDEAAFYIGPDCYRAANRRKILSGDGRDFCLSAEKRNAEVGGAAKRKQEDGKGAEEDGACPASISRSRVRWVNAQRGAPPHPRATKPGVLGTLGCVTRATSIAAHRYR